MLDQPDKHLTPSQLTLWAEFNTESYVQYTYTKGTAMWVVVVAVAVLAFMVGLGMGSDG